MVLNAEGVEVVGPKSLNHLAEGEMDHWCEAPMVLTAEGGEVIGPVGRGRVWVDRK